MASNTTSPLSLSAAPSSAPKHPIRAPLSPEDNDSPLSSDPDEAEEQVVEEEEEEGFGTASEGDEEGGVPRGAAALRGAARPLARWGSMPIAPVTLDEEDDEEVFEESEEDGHGFSPVARVSIPDQNPALGEKGGALGGEGDGVLLETGAPAPVEGGDGVLGVEEEKATESQYEKDENLDSASDNESTNAKENEEGEETSTTADSADGDFSVSGTSQSSFSVVELEDSETVDVGSVDKLGGANSGERDGDKVLDESSEHIFPCTVENTLDELNSWNDGESTGKCDTLNQETSAADGGETISALEESASSETSAADSVPILENSILTEQLLKESEKDYALEIDRQGILDSDSDEDEDKEEEADEKQALDPDAFAAALLNAATVLSISSQEASRIFSARPEIKMSDEEKNLHEKVESIRVDSDEDEDEDEDKKEEADEKQVLDPDALAATLLNAATGFSISSQEASRIFSAQPEIKMSDEEKDLHEKVESIRVDSDEDEDEDKEEEADEKQALDPDALSAALLNAATDFSISSQEASRIFSAQPEIKMSDEEKDLQEKVESIRVDSDSDEDEDEDEDKEEEADEKQVLDPDALAATLLNAATGFSISSQEASRIFSAQPEIKMSDEEKDLHEKVESIRVKFLRLMHRLGHSPEHFVVAQVLNRLTLADGTQAQMNRKSVLENSRKMALQIEAEGKEDLNFSCNILIIGKSGVGKSTIVNSIFDEVKSKTDAFEPATDSVKEIVGIVDGVKICIIDTPGLKPSLVDYAWNRRVLLSIKKYMKKCPPDIVLYVDRLDTQTKDFSDLPLLRLITTTLGSSIWYNAVVALTHAASAPPEDQSGSSMSYEVFVAHKSIVVQQAVKQASGDFRLVNLVALIENHPLCRRNTKGERVLPNGLEWKPELLLLCYTSKILSEANSLPSLPKKLFSFPHRSLPLPFLLSSLTQLRVHMKLISDGSGQISYWDPDLDDWSEVDKEQEQEEEDEYDQLPPFQPLRKAEIAKLTEEQRKAYFNEYDYRVRLFEKIQWKMVRRLAEMKKKRKSNKGDLPGGFYQGNAPSITRDLIEEKLPPSFDCNNPTYRYRFLKSTSQAMVRPKQRIQWDQDCGFDRVIVEDSLAFIDRFPAAISVDLTKDKEEFNINLVSSISAEHGKNGSTLVGFDIQTFGQQLTYALRGETKFKNFRKNTTTGGISLTLLGENVATGVKLEDQLSIGKWVSLALSAGAVRALSETAYAANLQVLLREKDNPIGQALSAIGLSLMTWRGELAFGANLQSQFNVGRSSKTEVQVGLNNKLGGQVSVRTSTSELSQIALVGILPIVIYLVRKLRFGTTS